ncbi:hypothetical protein BRADI_2g55694v3 [Brachypodium distachyon]|uniref:Uncharacterized protein n=1 Tax=Brachypodium distachyon TaxID=15368 RepID=A0A0Q3JE67_BRADI|nr:hypothetical protein BRADI_2g55694v3 [Brachypodium distachyon]
MLASPLYLPVWSNSSLEYLFPLVYSLTHMEHVVHAMLIMLHTSVVVCCSENVRSSIIFFFFYSLCAPFL